MSSQRELDDPEVTIELSNRFARIECEPETQEAMLEFFRYRRPGVEYSQLVRCGAWDGYTKMIKRGKIGTGLFLHQMPHLEQAGFRFTIDDKRTPLEFKDLPYSPKIRPYQQEAIEAMKTASKTGGLIIQATGTGKTFLAAEFFRLLVGSGIFIVDELTLLEQSRREIQSVIGERVGVVGRGEFDPQRITVATIQTLGRHRKKKEFKKWFKEVDVQLIDEFHLQMNKRNSDVLTSVQARAVYGMTATLEWRKKHVWMPGMAACGPVIFTYSLEKGVQEGYLATGKAVFVAFSCRSSEEDYHTLISGNKKRNDCIEALVREGIKRKRKVIVVVERLSHLRVLSRRLGDLDHQPLCGAYSRKERFQAIRRMKTGKLSLIIATRIFSKGVSIDSLDTIIDASGLPNHNAAIQRFGRGTRLDKGKSLFLHFDIADVGNYFQAASASRRQALQSLKIPGVVVVWEGDAERIFDQALKNKGLDLLSPSS